MIVFPFFLKKMTDEKNIHTVPAGVEAVRLSDYAAGIFAGLETKSGVKKAAKRGELFVAGQPASTATFVSGGMQIEWRRADYVPARAFKANIDVVYEDDFLAIVNKPAGIAVSGNRFDTVENALSEIIIKSSQPDMLPVPRAVHRLDSATSGLLIVAKTQKTRIALGNMLEQKQISKTYQAVAIGETPPSGIFATPVNGKEAVTRFETQKVIPSLVSGRLSLLKLYPETGRTHQIRIHLSTAGFPILGDKLYGDPAFMLRGKGLFLCATQLQFIHPATNQMLNAEIEIPRKFHRFLDGEQRRWEKYGTLRQHTGKDFTSAKNL